MHKFLAPHKSGAHRQAGIALFRALLTTSQRLNLPSSNVSALQNIVRNRFKHNKHVVSKHLLRVAFNAGYEALQLLHASIAGEATSQSRIQQYLMHIPSRLQQAPSQPRLRSTPAKARDFASRGFDEMPVVDRALSRPRATIVGKRHIPKLVNANLFPMLRFKKPQPPALGAYLRKRILKRTRRHESKNEFEKESGIWEAEDQWDEMMARQMGEKNDTLVEKVEVGNRWVDDVNRSIASVRGALNRETKKSLDLSERMQEIIAKEKALARKEELARRRESRH